MPFGLLGFATPYDMLFGAFLLLVGFFLIKGRKSGAGGGRLGPLLVLRKFVVNADPAAEVHLEIVGRVSGISGFILTLLRISPESSLTVKKTDLTLDCTSLFGRNHLSMPLNKVQATKSGYDRWPLAFWIGCFFFLSFLVLLLGSMAHADDSSGMTELLLFSLVCAAIAGAIFFFKRTLYITLGSGHFNGGMRFKRSILEGVTVDLDQLVHASDVLDHYVLLAQGALHTEPAAATAATGLCAKCGNQNAAGTKFCESCGTKL